MLGPVFLHWDGLYSTYCEFFCKISSALGFHIREEKIVFGSDEEQAMVNAIKTAFPKVQHILCTRHLKENAQRNLSAQNVPEKSRSRVTSAKFGSTGFFLQLFASRIERELEIKQEFAEFGGKYLEENSYQLSERKSFYHY